MILFLFYKNQSHYNSKSEKPFVKPSGFWCNGPGQTREWFQRRACNTHCAQASSLVRRPWSKLMAMSCVCDRHLLVIQIWAQLFLELLHVPRFCIPSSPDVFYIYIYIYILYTSLSYIHALHQLGSIMQDFHGPTLIRIARVSRGRKPSTQQP